MEEPQIGEHYDSERERARKLVTEFLILKQFAYDSN